MFRPNATRIASLLPFMLLAFVAVAPEIALAQDDIAEVSRRIEENITAIKSLALSVMFLVGLITFSVGIYLIHKDQKQPNQGHAKTGFVGMIVGVLLLSVVGFIGVIGNTVLGSDSDAVDNITIDSGF